MTEQAKESRKHKRGIPEGIEQRYWGMEWKRKWLEWLQSVEYQKWMDRK